jgi:hypothetical protein
MTNQTLAQTKNNNINNNKDDVHINYFENAIGL